MPTNANKLLQTLVNLLPKWRDEFVRKRSIDKLGTIAVEAKARVVAYQPA